MTRISRDLARMMASGPALLGYIGGRPIWEVAGGAPDDDGAGGGDAGAAGGDTGAGSGDDAGGSGDGAGSASAAAEVEKWKRLSRQNEQKAKENAAAAKELAALKDKDKTETQRLLDEATKTAREEATTELTAAYNRRLVSAEVRAAAGGRLADPADAVRLLDLDAFTVDGQGDVDAKAVKAAIDQLLKDKPYLAPAGAPRGSAGQGPRGTGSADKGDLNEQIRAAEAAGDRALARRLKLTKLG